MKKIIVGIWAGIFLIGLVSAVVTESNYAYKAVINNEGKLVKTKEAVKEFGAYEVVCKNKACSEIEDSWGGKLFEAAGKFINLVYPTVRESKYGYGIYFVKQGYIPWEYRHDLAGKGRAKNHKIYLTKQEKCISEINHFETDYDGENLIVKFNIEPPIKTSKPDPIKYMPSELLEHYQVETKVVVKIMKDRELYYKTCKTLDILYSENAAGSFKIPLCPGSYEVILSTEVPDEKCLGFESDEVKKTVIFQDNK